MWNIYKKLQHSCLDVLTRSTGSHRDALPGMFAEVATYPHNLAVHIILLYGCLLTQYYRRCGSSPIRLVV